MTRKPFMTHGDGTNDLSLVREAGEGCVLEAGVRIFHPENVILGSQIYIGHDTILKGYHQNTLEIGSGSWIGQRSFLHAAGGIRVGRNVGIGPNVTILTSQHQFHDRSLPVLHHPLSFEAVVIEDDADVGAGAILLPGVTIGRGSIVGAGAVVTKSVEPFSIVGGNPARLIKMRPE